MLLKNKVFTSDNSHYAVPASPAPKLPSLEDVFYEQDRFQIDDILYIHSIYKKLGNFA